MAKTVNARTLPVQSIGYKYGKLIIPPYEVDVEFTPLEEAALDSGINANMIPSTAGANNKLADRQYVDTAVSTYSAQFLGTSASGLTELLFLEWANSLDADNNDYCNWWTTDTEGKTIFKRYKYDGTLWLFEYIVADPSSVPTAVSQLTNDVGYITQELVIINLAFPSGWHTSGTMADLIADINADNNAIAGKTYMDTVSFSDLPADMLLAELKAEIISLLGNSKVIVFTVTSSEISPYHWEYTSAYGLTNNWREWVIPTDLAAVATSGSYTDLQDKPTIPAALVQSNWNETNTSSKAYIQNKPTIPTVPTNVSAFINDAGYLTQHQDISGKANKSEMSVTSSGDKTTITLKEGTSAEVLRSHLDISGKADKNEMSITNGTGDATIQLKSGTSVTVLTLHQDISGKADIGTASDAKTVNSLYGAKAYSKDLVDTSEYNLRNLSAILAFATGTGTVTLSTNPEWKLVLLDYADKVLLGKRRDNTWYLPMDLDDLLDSVIVDYGN